MRVGSVLEGQCKFNLRRNVRPFPAAHNKIDAPPIAVKAIRLNSASDRGTILSSGIHSAEVNINGGGIPPLPPSEYKDFKRFVKVHNYCSIARSLSLPIGAVIAIIISAHYGLQPSFTPGVEPRIVNPEKFKKADPKEMILLGLIPLLWVIITINIADKLEAIYAKSFIRKYPETVSDVQNGIREHLPEAYCQIDKDAAIALEHFIKSNKNTKF